MKKSLIVLFVLFACAGLWSLVWNVIDLSNQIDGLRYIMEGYDKRDKIERQLLKDAITDRELEGYLKNLGIKIPVKKK